MKYPDDYPKQFALKLWHAAKTRAAKKKIPFTITKEWVEDRLKDGVCEITGLPFEFNTASGVRRKPFAPSIEQVWPSGGYTTKNSKMVVSIYNIAKNEFEHEDVVRLARAFVPTYGEAQ